MPMWCLNAIFAERFTYLGLEGGSVEDRRLANANVCLAHGQHMEDEDDRMVQASRFF